MFLTGQGDLSQNAYCDALHYNHDDGGVSLGKQALNAEGVIADGPQFVSGVPWWGVDFLADPDGWVRQVSLRVQ